MHLGGQKCLGIQVDVWQRKELRYCRHAFSSRGVQCRYMNAFRIASSQEGRPHRLRLPAFISRIILRRRPSWTPVWLQRARLAGLFTLLSAFSVASLAYQETCLDALLDANMPTYSPGCMPCRLSFWLNTGLSVCLSVYTPSELPTCTDDIRLQWCLPG
jgi:hypothetical protein